MPDPAGVVDSAHANDPHDPASASLADREGVRPERPGPPEGTPRYAGPVGASAQPGLTTGAPRSRPGLRASTPRSHAGPGRPSRLGLFLATAAVAVSADVVSKVLIVADLDPLEPRRLFGGALYLVLTRNGGAAFSLGPGATIVFTLVAVVIVGLLVRVAGRLRSSGWAVALGLVLGGALGNLVDRLARAPGFGRGHVVDWISLFADDGHIWPIFNLADAAIVVGGVLGAVLALRGVELDGRRSADNAPGADNVHGSDDPAALG